MSVRGVEPSFFAGMPTVQRDPLAGRPGEGYARMPGEALTEIANRKERQDESAQNNAFRAREQSHREQQDQQSGARDDRRLAMYQQGEDRRQTQQQVENDRLKAADTRKLVQAMHEAVHDKEWGIAAAIGDELRGRGIPVTPITGEAGAVTPPGAPPAPPGPPKVPMSAADAQKTGSELDQAGNSMVSKLSGGPRTAMPTPSVPPAQSPQDAALSGQLDQIDQRYMAGLQKPGTPELRPVEGIANPYRPLLPGRRLGMGVARSNAMLSPDDPLNNIQ